MACTETTIYILSKKLNYIADVLKGRMLEPLVVLYAEDYHILEGQSGRFYCLERTFWRSCRNFEGKLMEESLWCNTCMLIPQTLKL